VIGDSFYLSRLKAGWRSGIPRTAKVGNIGKKTHDQIAILSTQKYLLKICLVLNGVFGDSFSCSSLEVSRFRRVFGASEIRVDRIGKIE
jgi:hypothetical protein